MEPLSDLFEICPHSFSTRPLTSRVDWVQEADFLTKYAEDMNDDVLLYDIRLVHNFRDISWSQYPDLRTVFDGTLAKVKPEGAVVSCASPVPMQADQTDDM